MSNPSLRKKIIAYMSEPDRGSRGWYCTWWFRLHIDGTTTKESRQELERMEKEGLCESDHSMSNNTQWRLKK